MRKSLLHIASATMVAALVPGAALAQDCVSDARRIVDAIYTQVLERNANGEGAPAVTQLSQGQTTVRELVRNMARSEEHVRRFMSGNRPDNVTYAYRHLLGRGPDPGGLEAHVRVLETESPTAVVDNLIDSAEYQQAFSDDVVPGARLRYCRSTGTSTDNTMRFRGMDRNGNGVIERAEWNGSANSFTVHDWNKDGTLSREEVRLGGRRGAQLPEEDDFNPTGPATWTTRNFQLLDRNRDNRVSSNEWFYAPEYFRRADRDRNGSLNAAEFTGAGGGAWDDDRDDRFEDLDLNRNGRVELSEWHGSADAFSWLDRNRDNVLSRTEVVGETTTAGDDSFNSFSSLDYNRNSVLEFTEWRWSRRSFTTYDSNGDGRLSRQEFTAQGGAPTTAR